MKGFLLLALISLSTQAQDYTLYQAENDHYRDYTREQLMERIGPNASILSHYACNGRDELDLYWPAIRQNENENSLKIQLKDSEEKIIYRQGEYFKLDGTPVADLSNSFVAEVVEALKKIEAMPEGKLILRQLERSHFPLTIVHGNNGFNPKEEGGRSYIGIFKAQALSIFNHGRMTSEEVPFDNVGSGGNIGWNPKTKDIPPFVALAHEMYHAFDSIRGLLDMRFVQGPAYEQAFISEYRAVYFENLARKAVGFKLRTHYGQDQTGSGVLDEHGEPRKMPSPCLK